MRTVFAHIFLSFIFLLPASVFGQEAFSPKNATYLWPTQASPYLTSTFAETRAEHFHAALDIKTWGRRGYDVVATRDGTVYRIAIGPKGYGKVVYLKHRDGSFSVYAHLMSFNNELQQLADSIRFSEDYRFEIDRFIEHENIKVKQGETIGISGASGIGPPHLHFELRTPSHKPFNPLLTNLTVKDNIAPQIQAISVEPLAARSTIEGKNEIFTKRAWKNGSNYEVGNIEVSGPVGLGVKVFDQSNDVHNVYAVYELSLSVDGNELFSARADSFSFKETDQMFIDRVYPVLQKYGSAYQRLYLANGNSLPFYKTGDSAGVLNLEPGPHQITVRATDYFGNSSTVSLALMVEENEVEHPKLAQNTFDKKSNSFVQPYQWDWYENWLTVGKDNFRQLTVASTDSSQFLKYDNGIGVRLKDGLFMNIPKIGPVKLRRMNPHSVQFIGAADQKSFAVFPKNTFYDTVSVGMSVQQFKADSIRVNIIPEAFPIRYDYRFYVKRNSALTDTSNLAFYKWDRQDIEWETVPTVFTKNYIVAKAETFGSFTALRDSTSPRLRNPHLAQRPDGQWLVVVDVTDNLSGIDYGRTKIAVNGVRGIAEYEPEDRRFVYYHPDFEPSPEMKVEVTAFDKMGNREEQIFHINKPEMRTD